MPKLATLNVDSDIVRRLRTVVLAKHGQLYGRLQQEANEALERHIRFLGGQ